MPRKVDGPTLHERARILREQGEARRATFLAAHVGRRWDGVVEVSPADGEEREIMLDDYATVWAPAPATAGRRRVTVEVETLDARGRLRGRLTAAPAALSGSARSEG